MIGHVKNHSHRQTIIDEQPPCWSRIWLPKLFHSTMLTALDQELFTEPMNATGGLDVGLWCGGDPSWGVRGTRHGVPGEAPSVEELDHSQETEGDLFLVLNSD
jgi:hypothetical protein